MTSEKKASRLPHRNAVILRLLRSDAGAVGAARLAGALGVNMESVANYIQDLTKLGYPILSHQTGFQLSSPGDLLFPWEFEGREDRVHFFPEIDSTMIEARRMAQAECPHFTVVLAERQTQGRGRLKRTWLSADGGLYFTLVLRPDLRPKDSGQINFLASVVLATVLRDHFGIDAGVKWPNDILVENRKIAGMLSEQATDNARVYYINMGIGLNVNNDPSPVEPNATSLKKLLGKQVLRAPLLNRFLDELERNMENLNWEATLESWRKLSVTLNRQVRIVTTRETVEGMAMDVDSAGALILQLADGTSKKIVYGDCFIPPQ